MEYKLYMHEIQMPFGDTMYKVDIAKTDEVTMVLADHICRAVVSKISPMDRYTTVDHFGVRKEDEEAMKALSILAGAHNVRIWWPGTEVPR